MSGPMPTEAECIAKAGRVFAQMEATAAQMTPRQLAEASYTPTGPSVDELEAMIRAERGLPARIKQAS